MSGVKQPGQKSPWVGQDGRLTPEALNFVQSIINVLNGQADGNYTVYDFRLFKITVGAGTPNGNVVGSPPDIYLNTSGGASTTMYLKESGTDTNTGWAGV